jgi:hypothetical protein
MALLYDEDYVKQFIATVGFRKILSESTFSKGNPIQSVIDANLIPRFLQLVSLNHHQKLQ